MLPQAAVQSHNPNAGSFNSNFLEQLSEPLWISALGSPQLFIKTAQSCCRKLLPKNAFTKVLARAEVLQSCRGKLILKAPP
jgi:hypothetical protein